DGWRQRSRGRVPWGMRLYRQQVGFLFGVFLVDEADVVVGHLLDVLLRAALVVLADGFFLEQLLDVVVGVAADVAHRHTGVFGLGLGLLGVVAAGLLGEHGHRYTDHVAIVGGVQA